MKPERERGGEGGRKGEKIHSPFLPHYKTSIIVGVPVICMLNNDNLQVTASTLEKSVLTTKNMEKQYNN